MGEGGHQITPPRNRSSRAEPVPAKQALEMS